MLHIPWRHVHIPNFRMQGRIGNEKPAYLPGMASGRAGSLKGDAVPAEAGLECRQAVRRVRVNCWPAELVQLSWLAEISRQLKLIGDWRISDVPLIWTELAPVRM
jgi:hypothetical protein